jgi:hypothetical protein
VQVRAILMVMRATECVSVPVWDANAEFRRSEPQARDRLERFVIFLFRE